MSRRLSVEQRKRLYETLGALAETLPDEWRRDFYLACRDRVLWVNDTSRIIERRALVRSHLPDLVVDDWRWAIAVLPDGGGDEVLRRWATDAGIARAVTTRGDGS